VGQQPPQIERVTIIKINYQDICDDLFSDLDHLSPYQPKKFLGVTYSTVYIYLDVSSAARCDNAGE